MNFGNLMKRVFTEVPAAVAAGVARQETNKKYAPAVATTPVPNAMLYIDGAMVVVGEVGKAFRNPVWEEATEGLALAGVAYLTEDGIRRYKNGSGAAAATATTTTTTTAARAQTPTPPANNPNPPRTRRVSVVEI
jgi:hypothetical protein